MSMGSKRLAPRVIFPLLSPILRTHPPLGTPHQGRRGLLSHAGSCRERSLIGDLIIHLKCCGIEWLLPVLAFSFPLFYPDEGGAIMGQSGGLPILSGGMSASLLSSAVRCFHN